MSRGRVIVGACALLAVAGLDSGVASAGRRFTVTQPNVVFTDEFAIENCTFASSDQAGNGNPLFPLIVGSVSVLEGDDERVEITIKDETETISFTTDDGAAITVEARVIEEREFEDGEIVEISQNWFARCVETGDVFYFGETVVGAGGQWRAGENGAQPGIIMPGRYLLGSRYFQEQAPRVAMDRAEHIQMDLEIDVPAGAFEDCVRIRETSPLEPGHKTLKVYCPGVGLVVDNKIELTEYSEN